MIYNNILISLLAAIPLSNAAVTSEPAFELISEVFEAGQMVTNPDISIGAPATSAAEKREHAECWNNSKLSLKNRMVPTFSLPLGDLLGAQRPNDLLLENSLSAFKKNQEAYIDDCENIAQRLSTSDLRITLPPGRAEEFRSNQYRCKMIIRNQSQWQTF
ncbi:hypothetical protein CSAL01_10667 [Colletotrichum salicis]|uniref:DUF1311 domain-containing protein n=1 Tax=Colletotrichum salicis TaxID=1209931 RepID=A0A135USG9_9PEZI|nr:hypothetical protein CSAL01_10667 [Colletotrichum salicis]